MGVRLPEQVGNKVRSFPESSMGAHTVTLVLVDGARIPNVVVAWGDDIVRIGSRQIAAAADLDFPITDVIDAVTDSNQ